MKRFGLAIGPRRLWRASLALAAFAAGVGGCSTPWPVTDIELPRNRGTDFLAKDFELRPYRPVSERLARDRRRVMPSPSAAALGDGAGAFAGGRYEAWRTSAAPALGDLGGAVAGETLHRATRLDPLPEKYTSTDTFIPIVATDPNAGPTVGIMPVSVLREGERITNIFAPQITWNEIDGGGALFRMRRSFTLDSALSVDAGSTENGAHTYEVKYNQAKIGPYDALLFRARVRYVTELYDRFFGLGSDTKKRDESAYTLRRSDALVGLGVQLPFSARLEFAELISVSSIGKSAIDGIRSAKTAFADVEGMQDTTELLGHRITLTIDTRDRAQATTNGILFESYYEIGDATLASDVSYQKAGFSFSGVISYTILDWLFATAGRFGMRWVAGKNVPFFEQTSVGGKTTLRGFGEGRFVGKNGFVAGIEERWNIWDINVMGYSLVIQIAGFGEMGRVFGGADEPTFQTIKFAAGGAVRLIIPASDIVTSIDMGVSKEGFQTFVDLGYPF